jgi:hypothetical protein
MRDALRAELLKLRKRPSTWVLVVLSIYFVVFTYFIVDFIIFYLAREGAILLTEPLRLQLARVLPHELIENVMEKRPRITSTSWLSSPARSHQAVSTDGVR